MCTMHGICHRGVLSAHADQALLQSLPPTKDQETAHADTVCGDPQADTAATRRCRM